MSKYKEILRYHVTGLSQREIQKVTGISRPTISLVLTAFSKKSLKWEEVRELSEEEISSKLFEKMNDASSIIYEYPDYEQMTDELAKPGVTKKLLWQEYVEACLSSGKVPLQYSQFCDCFSLSVIFRWEMPSKYNLRIVLLSSIKKHLHSSDDAVARNHILYSLEVAL